jgi:hypothetical protein
MTGPNAAAVPLQFVTLPARLLSRWRGDLAETIAEDDKVFGNGWRRSLYVLLVLVCVGYPLVISYFHATLPFVSRDPSEFGLAIRPFITWVWSESLWFMVAIGAVGLLSPALGVTSILVFAPADLIAANFADGLQLVPLLPGVAARLVSYGLLWVLAVEIPVRARRWAARSGRERDSLAGRVGPHVRRVVAIVVLVYFWAQLVPVLIQPVLNWVGRQMTPEASVALWAFWPILLAALAVVAAAQTVIVDGIVGFAAPERRVLGTRAGSEPPSASQALARDLAWVAGLSLLLAGLVQDGFEALILVTGLLVAIPILNLVLPRIRGPRWLAAAPRSLRWVLAVVLCFVGAEVTFQILAGGGPDYPLLVLVTAVAMSVFRIVLEAGTGAAVLARDGAPREVRVKAPPTIVSGLAIALLVASLWLLWPQFALANDCPSGQGTIEVVTCWIAKQLGAAAAAVGAAIAAAAAAIRILSSDPPGPLPPMDIPGPPRPPTPELPRLPGSFYDPKTGEPWDRDSRRPYPTDPKTGEGIDPRTGEPWAPAGGQ